MEVYLGLFGASFLAATLVPFSSELLLLGLLVAGHDPWALWLVASLGNIGGAWVNWALGRGLWHYRHRAWFRHQQTRLTQAEHWFRRYGLWSLLFTWLPLIGDALGFVAGLLRVPLALFLPLCGIGKAGRYGRLVWLALAASSPGG